jgi:cell division septum initiation protein DivIVA
MTVEDKVKMALGNLLVENIALATRVEELERKLAELEQAKPTE